MRISFLFYENEPIVYEYGFLVNNYYVGEQIAYHNDYKKVSPGKIMLYYLLPNLVKQGVTVLDQGGGISDYKSLFSKEYRFLYNIYYSNNAVVMMWWKLINTIRRYKQLMFPKKFIPVTRETPRAKPTHFATFFCFAYFLM